MGARGDQWGLMGTRCAHGCYRKNGPTGPVVSMLPMGGGGHGAHEAHGTRGTRGTMGPDCKRGMESYISGEAATSLGKASVQDGVSSGPSERSGPLTYSGA